VCGPWEVVRSSGKPSAGAVGVKTSGPNGMSASERALAIAAGA